MFLHGGQVAYENLVKWVKWIVQRKAKEDNVVVNQDQKKIHRKLTPLQKGFKRLTMVLSILTGIGFPVFLAISVEPPKEMFEYA